MATRPTVGGSDGTWGSELNAHLDVSLDTDGKVDDGAAQTTSAAPGADAELANMKYVDDRHDVAIAYVDATYLAGQSVQVVNTQTGAVATGSTTIPRDDTIPQKTEGDEYMTLAITPTNSNNKLKIDVVCILANTSGNFQPVVALFQDSIANAIACVKDGSTQDGNTEQTVVFTHFMTAGTTSTTTFKIRAGQNVGTVTFNGSSGVRKYGGVLASSITITEIKV